MDNGTDTKGTILLIDDNEDHLRIASMTLQALGYATLVADQPEEGLRLARDESPDLIMLDLYMPGMDGYELARVLSLNESTKRIPYIVLSSASGDRFQKKSMDWGARAFLPKDALPAMDKDGVPEPSARLRKDQLDRKQLGQILEGILADRTAPG